MSLCSSRQSTDLYHSSAFSLCSSSVSWCPMSSLQGPSSMMAIWPRFKAGKLSMKKKKSIYTRAWLLICRKSQARTIKWCLARIRKRHYRPLNGLRTFWAPCSSISLVWICSFLWSRKCSRTSMKKSTQLTIGQDLNKSWKSRMR